MEISTLKQFRQKTMDDGQLEEIRNLADKARADILRMTTGAGSGHPGGSLSSVDLYLTLWLCANVSPETVNAPKRDKIVISHGHTSSAVYATLGNLGYCDVEQAVGEFRREGSIFEGHPSLHVPGVEWCSGSLGQGLSVGCGFALAAKMKGQASRVFVVMGDGEQEKGQLQEAREFAVKYRLNNLVAIVDCNGLQASGELKGIMPQPLAEKYEAAGWNVISVSGHDYRKLYEALRTACRSESGPTVILAKTVMGKGVFAIEDDFRYHGKTLSDNQYKEALEQLKISNGADGWKLQAQTGSRDQRRAAVTDHPEERMQPGEPIVYGLDADTDCRSAFGNALLNLVKANPDEIVAAIDCDLAESVKVSALGKEFPERLIECGIQEHNAATVAASLSKCGIVPFFADFGAFGIDETYGQHRMSDLNHSSVKLICTHNGLDVGEDGKTHQCIDYISLMSNLLDFQLLIPADPNQTDRMIRYAATTPGNICVVMGRSKVPVLADNRGEVLYSRDYSYHYGRYDWVREGSDGVIIACGAMVHRAVQAAELLEERRLSIGVLNCTSPLQIDGEAIEKAARTGLIMTYEDHNVRSGMGTLIGSYLAEQGLRCRFVKKGVNSYGASAAPDWLYRQQGLDAESVAACLGSVVLLEGHINTQ